MNVIAIIPARMGSTRFPGKPLKKIHGMPMIEHVYHRCKMSKNLDEVWIATCDEAIQNHAKSIGAPCVMTSNLHERCSDRTAEAMLKIEKLTQEKVDVVVMVQGDEPMVTPKMIDLAINTIVNTESVSVVNLMAKMSLLDDFEDPNEVKVVVDNNQDALYFSREPIPSRKKGYEVVPMYKQVCIIPFRRDYLLHFNALAPASLEIIESVDMLRVLEHGDKVKMVLTEDKSCSVDTVEDLRRAEGLMCDDEIMRTYCSMEKVV